MSDTAITYNGIHIKDVLTDSIYQDTVPDPSGTDPEYVRVVVSCTGLVHASEQTDNTQIGVNARIYGGDLATGWNAINQTLQQPRRRFIMRVGSSLMFDVRPAATRPGLSISGGLRRNLDVNHGPIPSCRIMEIISSRTMRVQFSIVMHLPWCDAPGNSVGAISFRFWIADDINCDRWTTDRVYHGRLRVMSRDFSVFKVLRENFGFPPLQKGFQRRRVSMSQSPNGLELEFTVRDEEMWAVAPGPATKWDGYHALSSPQPGLATQESELYVSLEGPRETPKKSLIALAHKICEAKLHYGDMVKKKQGWLINYSVRESLKDNAVEISARVRQIGNDNNDPGLWNVVTDSLGLQLNELPAPLDGYDPEVAVLGKSSDSSLRGLFIAFLNDPCHVSGYPPEQPFDKKVETQAGEGPAIVVEDLGDDLPPNEDLYSNEHRQESAYNLYKMSSDIGSHNGFAALPVSHRKQSNDPTVAIVSLHAGFSTRNIRIEAERLEAWPTVPKPETFTAGSLVHQILSSKVFPSSPQLDAQGKKTLYHIVYELDFSLSKVPDHAQNEFLASLMPYRVADSQNQVFAVPATAFADANGFLYQA